MLDKQERPSHLSRAEMMTAQHLAGVITAPQKARGRGQSRKSRGRMLRTWAVMLKQVMAGTTYCQGDADPSLSRRAEGWMSHIPRENFLEWILGGKSKSGMREVGMNDSTLQGFASGVGYCLGKDA